MTFEFVSVLDSQHQHIHLPGSQFRVDKTYKLIQIAGIWQSNAKAPDRQQTIQLRLTVNPGSGNCHHHERQQRLRYIIFHRIEVWLYPVFSKIKINFLNKLSIFSLPIGIEFSIVYFDRLS
jgi:hypothetical protein